MLNKSGERKAGKEKKCEGKKMEKRFVIKKQKERQEIKG